MKKTINQVPDLVRQQKARSEMRWEMGFSASEIASAAFSNPKMFRAQ
jgi:hypothetical protein